MSDDLPPDVAKLLVAERERGGPSAGESARLIARVNASLALSADFDGTSTGKGAAGASLLAKPALVGAVALVLGAVAGAAADRALTPPKIVYVDRVVERVVESASPSASTALPLPHSESPSPSPVPAPRPSTASAPAASGSGRDHALAAERALVESARTALSRDDAATALATLERHAARFPSGVLTEEREALAIQALARLGRSSDARARADRFRKTFPSSMLTPVVDAAVQQR
jgi:hypothetical protein